MHIFSMFRTLMLTFLMTTAQCLVASEYPASISASNTIALGAAVGACDGIISRLTDFAWPLNWIFMHELRAIVLKAIAIDARAKGAAIDASLLGHTASLTSWITYLLVLSKTRIPYIVDRQTNVYTIYI